MSENNLNYEELQKSIINIDEYLKWRFGEIDYKPRDMKIKIQISFKENVAFEGVFSRNEEFVSEISRAIRHRKDPIAAIAVLMGIGSRELYTSYYKKKFDTYF